MYSGNISVFEFISKHYNNLGLKNENKKNVDAATTKTILQCCVNMECLTSS